MKRTTILLAITIGLLLPASLAWAQSDETEVRVYPVGDIIVQVPSYTYGQRDPGSSSLPAAVSKGATYGMGGGMGGGGVGGGMGGGLPRQGDYFSVPAQVRGDGGTSVFSGASYQEFTRPKPESPIELLAVTITSSVDPLNWDTAGGSGSCNIFESSLVITQTPATHEKIAALLSMLRDSGATARTVCIEARWLQLDSRQLGTLQGRDSPGNTETSAAYVDPVNLDQLTVSVSSFRGQITCFSGQKIFLVGGERRNVIMSVIPVVGGEVGYQPIIEVPNVGVLLEGSATLMPESNDALLDVMSTVTKWIEPGPPVWIGAAAGEDRDPRAMYSTNDSTAAAVSKPGLAPVDRVIMSTQQLGATLRVPLGQPILVGGLTMSPGDPIAQGAERPQLYLIVRVTAVK